MEFTRRSFIQGLGTAAVGIVGLQNAFGQSKVSNGLFPIPPASLSDSLSNLTSEHFRPFVGGLFQAVGNDGRVFDLRLVNVRDIRGGVATRSKARGDAFSLMFEGNPSDFVAGTYRFDHPGVGAFAVLVNAVNKDNVRCEAVINRLSSRGR